MLQRLTNTWIEHPTIDLALFLVVAVGAHFSSLPTLMTTNGFGAFLEAGATTSGLVMATATFACTMTYQSSSMVMAAIRRRFGDAIRRSWGFIIVTTLLSSVAFALILALPPTTAVASVSIALLALTTLEGLRSVWWLTRTLSVEHAEDVVSDRASPRDKEFLSTL